ncbi:MAG: 1,6-anhydro-N-acetylmuramyl-L-alanine amidase AmpD [Pseudomonadota bacterium]
MIVFDPITGRSPDARWHPSPHFDARPDGFSPELLVVHSISLPPDEFGGPYIDDLFAGTLDISAHESFQSLRGYRVSAHLLIRRDGELVQYVSCHDRAWHAGASTFQGRENCNDFSVGVELEGSDRIPYRAIQYRRLADVYAGLADIYPMLALNPVVGHADIAPSRKTDPGPQFDWPGFRAMLPVLLADNKP